MRGCCNPTGPAGAHQRLEAVHAGELVARKHEHAQQNQPSVLQRVHLRQVVVGQLELSQVGQSGEFLERGQAAVVELQHPQLRELLQPGRYPRRLDLVQHQLRNILNRSAVGLLRDGGLEAHRCSAGVALRSKSGREWSQRRAEWLRRAGAGHRRRPESGSIALQKYRRVNASRANF